MKPALALFFGIFASGLALGSYMKPSINKVSCRSYYTLHQVNSPADSFVQVQGPNFADQNFTGLHHQMVYENDLKVSFGYNWDEASNFRDLEAQVQVLNSDSKLIRASTHGKPTTAVHLDNLNLPVQRNGYDQLRAIDLFCGISEAYL